MSDSPVTEDSGQLINSRFNGCLIIGSVCGLLEITRNSLNLWAKCFHHRKLAVAFSILGFVTAYLFVLNFILMQLYIFTHDGIVCSGSNLPPSERKEKLDDKTYLVGKGFFLYIMVMITYGMIALAALSVLCLACTFKY